MQPSLLLSFFLVAHDSQGDAHGDSDEFPVLSTLRAPDPARLRAYNRLLSFEQTSRLVAGYTMVNYKFLNLSRRAMKDLNDNDVAGDVVECGVWRGGSTMMLILSQLQTAAESHTLARDFWLFDTFEGNPPPSKEDGKVLAGIYHRIKAGKDKGRESSGLATRVDGGRVKWNYGPLDVVRGALAQTGYPSEQVHLVRGKVEDTLVSRVVRRALPERIALLRLDTDWFNSTKAELDHLFDRLAPGGYLIIDDYCSWTGSRKAVDTFFTDRGLLHKLEAAKLQRPCLHYRKGP